MKNFPYEYFSGIKIGVGDSPLRGRKLFKTDYWISSNPLWLQPWDKRSAKAVNSIRAQALFVGTATLLFQDSRHLPKIVAQCRVLVETPIIYFDHLNSDINLVHQPIKNAKSTLPNYENIQEVVMSATGTPTKYSPGSSVAIHGLALALILGCRPIFLTGIELPRLLKDYKYYEPKFWWADEIRFGSLGPYNDEFCLPQFRQRRGPLGPNPVTHKLMLLKSRILHSAGNAQLSDFGRSQAELTADFEHLSGLLISPDGLPQVFNTSKTSLLNGMRNIRSIRHDEVLNSI
jgi:hypothetical protein